eukprot:225867_1
MYVIKRDGRKEGVCFDKVTTRIRNLSSGLSVDPTAIAAHVIAGLYAGVNTSDLDILASRIAADKITTHTDYGELASRIAISNIHKLVGASFSECWKKLLNHNLVGSQYSTLLDNKALMNQLDTAIVHDRDYNLGYFGIKTLTKSYLLKMNGKLIERPQHLWMRVALGIHSASLNEPKLFLESVLLTYNLMSQKYFTHATPTLFNAATPRPQLSSCFLLTMKEDSIEGIYDTIKDCAVISKHSGGIGVSISNIRCKGSPVSCNGVSNGIVPMLRVMNNTARYVDQGGGKRKGSFAIYLEPWHADIFDYLQLKKNHGKEEERCRDLFYCLWVSDLFMKRVKNDEMWSLMCPRHCKGLNTVFGKQFETLYLQYEEQNMYRSQVKARRLWSVILHTQMETGMPFMMYKDACNRKSNQQNAGTIQNGNLCTEIVQYCDKNEIAVCNLASISLPMFVDVDKQRFDFDKLIQITGVITENLNKIIDINYYPLEECRRSNLRHRPIGIGVQGLADVFLLLRMPFDSDEAKKLNKLIFETIYYGAVKKSNELAMKEGVYPTYEGSPASKGLLQFDLWDNVETAYDWTELKANIAKYGLRNSLLTAPMPTASTSQILGNNECFEPYTSNVYVRRTLAGDFVCINSHLLRDLIQLGIWNPLLKDQLIANNGSVQGLDEIPMDLKRLYKTVFEIKQRVIIDMAADRGPFIDQSQSMNIHLNQPTFGQLTSMHFYGWHKGLKTGMYYLRTKPATDAIKFTICPTITQKASESNGYGVGIATRKVISKADDDDDRKEQNEEHVVSVRGQKITRNDHELDDDYKEDVVTYKLCARYNKDDCLMCGS